MKNGGVGSNNAIEKFYVLNSGEEGRLEHKRTCVRVRNFRVDKGPILTALLISQM